jgi:hypothetical protein
VRAKPSLGNINTRITLNKKQDPIQKITKAKQAAGIAQVGECPLSKCKAWSSHPNNHQKKKERKRKREKERENFYSITWRKIEVNEK